MAPGREMFLDICFDLLDIDAALAWIVGRDRYAPFAYVVTPNVDHIVRLAREPSPGPVREAYECASLCLCDSRVIAKLGRIAGVALPVVPGSDLTECLFSDHIAAGDGLCLIGGDDTLLGDLSAKLQGCRIVQHVPPMGLRHDEHALDAAAAFVREARARYVLLAVGSPQQELLARRISDMPGAVGTGLCIGASIEFVTGAKTRAPRWMRRAGLEWLHRLLSEPRRLWRRYLIEGPRIFLIVLRWRLRR